jgi:CheY-like chemotaxis protein
MDKAQINILLADDDQDDRRFFENALKKLPTASRLTTVDDGDELMKYLEENKEALPDVLFLDINMPRKNGFECLEEIRKNENLKNLPIFIFSTSYAQEKINKVFKSGAHVYIRKPSNFLQLIQLIRHALPIAGENTFPNNQLRYILNA